MCARKVLTIEYFCPVAIAYCILINIEETTTSGMPPGFILANSIFCRENQFRNTMDSPNKCSAEIGNESEIMKEQIFGCYSFFFFQSRNEYLVLLCGPLIVLSRSASNHFGRVFSSASQFEVFSSEFDLSTGADASWLSVFVASAADTV